jgi:hypothetical protein
MQLAHWTRVEKHDRKLPRWDHEPARGIKDGKEF